ncbi:hypothetical protein CBOM_01097 [Ceraceosorus bombacis]|uniref:HAM1-like N-terminal domain-containing protein n=1 Tax=Ceraceosorus bombacis TaxID=401625 RepID=A0A0P1BBD9_9BASI|nr:hypothetical protein CBOM_01097 [Ceraceosorus bombacis]
MSSAGLAKAKSEVAAKPSKNAVTDATDPKQIDADVNRKLKFFGVIQAFRSGRYPDNKQIDEALNHVVLTLDT